MAAVLVAAVALALVAPAAVAAAPLVVSLDFDDGAAEAYVADGLLEAHGMRGSFYINSGLVGDPGYMSWAQLAELQAHGHEIAGHTRSHPRLAEVYSTVGAAEVRRQVCGDRLELRRHGFDVTEFAYPYGSAGAGVEAIVRDCGYRTGRADHGIPATGEPAAELIPPPDPYYTRIPPPPMSTTPLETLQSYVTRAEPAGGWVQILFHRICDGCRPYSTPEPVFTAFLDWLATRVANGTVVVKTVQQVMDEYWASDTVAPETSISSAPSQLPVGASADFEFSSSEEVSSFACQLDDGAWEPCYSPTSYTGLAQGVHSFAARATDRGRNTDPSPARHEFTVGTPPPPPPVSSPGPAAPPPAPVAASPAPPVATSPARKPSVRRDTSVAFQLDASRSQQALKQKGIVVFVRCPAERCTAAVAATIRIAKTAKRLRLKRVTRTLRRGQRAKLALRLSSVQREQLARALRSRNARLKPVAHVTVTVTDAAKNRKAKTLTVTLTR